MSLYNHYIVPKIIRATCATKPVMKQREKIVPLAEGRVLEIGAGGGLNLAYLDASKVTRLYGLDNSPELLKDTEIRSRNAGINFEPLLLDAAQIPLENSEVDTVLITYTMCSIDNLDSALAEMRRVLKPGGKLIFCEHGAAPDDNVLRWQKRLTPVWKRLGGGCRLDRDLPQEIKRAGFSFVSLDQMYLPGTWRIVGYNSWGIATPN